MLRLALRTCTSTLIVATLSFASGCPAADETTDGDGSSSGSSSSTGPMVGTLPNPSTSGVDSTTSGTVDPSTTGDSSSGGGFIPRPDIGGPGDPLPLGEQCEADEDCQSRKCYFFAGAPVGFCSECVSDRECMMDGGPGTCSFFYAGGPYASCSDGAAGVFCESTPACAEGLYCVPFSKGSPISQCGECITDAECDPDLYCTPTSQTGTTCVTMGAVANDEPCPIDGSIVCASGHCTPALYMGMDVDYWACGECTTDDDCDPGQTCQPGDLGGMTLTGSFCM